MQQAGFAAQPLQQRDRFPPLALRDDPAGLVRFDQVLGRAQVVHDHRAAGGQPFGHRATKRFGKMRQAHHHVDLGQGVLWSVLIADEFEVVAQLSGLLTGAQRGDFVIVRADQFEAQLRQLLGACGGQQGEIFQPFLGDIAADQADAQTAIVGHGIGQIQRLHVEGVSDAVAHCLGTGGDHVRNCFGRPE